MALGLKEGVGGSQLPEATVHQVNAIPRGLVGRVPCAVDPAQQLLFYNDRPEVNSQNPVVVCVFTFIFSSGG